MVGCIGGALVLDDYVSRLKRAGFTRVAVEKHAEAARKMVEVRGPCRRRASITCSASTSRPPNEERLPS